jgi:hypothetical protein
VDEGWETELVRAYCRTTRGLWTPAKGVPGLKAPRLEPSAEHPATVRVGNFHFKHDLARLLELARPGGRPEPGYWHLHSSPSHSYLKHMTSEEWAPKANRAGTDVEEYEWRTLNRNNHWWDCEVLAWAAAYACGIRVGGSPASRPKRYGVIGKVGR